MKPASRMKRKTYEKELEKLQVELCHLQAMRLVAERY
jgi:polyphosphate kinase